MAGAGFSNIPEKYENVVFIIKNPQNRNKCFQEYLSDHKKFNFLLKNQLSILYECVIKINDDYRSKYLDDFLKLKLIFCNFLNLYGHYLLWYESF